MGHFVKEMSTALLRSKHLPARKIAIASIALAGVVHLFIVPEHFSHSAVHGSFLAVIGVAQLLWALWFRWRSSAALYWAGVSLSGGVVVTWLLAFFVSVSYSSHLDPIGASLTASKILEITGLFALIIHGAATAFAATGRSSIYRLAGRSILGAVIFGAVIWGGGKGVELIYSGPEDGPAQGSAQSPGGVHPGEQEGDDSNRFEPIPEGAALDPQATPDIQAMANAAVESALAALEMNDASSGLSPEIQAMIRLAVDSALSQEITPTPLPGLPSDIQAIVAVAVAAALNSDHALTPEPGQHRPGGHVNSPAAESAPLSLTDRPDLVSQAPTSPLKESALKYSSATPAPTPAPAPSMGPIEPLLLEENQSDLKRMLFGGALVALILIAVVGAVRTWNEIS